MDYAVYNLISLLFFKKKNRSLLRIFTITPALAFPFSSDFPAFCSYRSTTDHMYSWSVVVSVSMWLPVFSRSEVCSMTAFP